MAEDGIVLKDEEFGDRPHLLVEEALAACEALGDAVGLALGAHRRGVGGQVAGGGDQTMRPGRCVAQPRELAHGGLDRLDGVEVAVLAQQQAAEQRQQGACRVGPGGRVGERGGDQTTSGIDLLLSSSAGRPARAAAAAPARPSGAGRRAGGTFRKRSR